MRPSSAPKGLHVNREEETQPSCVRGDGDDGELGKPLFHKSCTRLRGLVVNGEDQNQILNFEMTAVCALCRNLAFTVASSPAVILVCVYRLPEVVNY